MLMMLTWKRIVEAKQALQEAKLLNWHLRRKLAFVRRSVRFETLEMPPFR